ncbi:MAG: hypothetical protein ABIH23_16615 [bacterium]
MPIKPRQARAPFTGDLDEYGRRTNIYEFAKTRARVAAQFGNEEERAAKRAAYDAQYGSPTHLHPGYSAGGLTTTGGMTTTAAPNPYAWVQGARDINEYSGLVTAQARRTGQMPAMPDLSQIQPAEGTAGTAYRNPFAPETSGFMNRQQWQQFRDRLAMIHKPDPLEQAKQYEQAYFAQAAGAKAIAPTPMSILLTHESDANDETVLRSQKYLSPEIQATIKKERRQIQQQFVDAMTQYGGSMRLKDLMDVGDNLARRFPQQDGFIRDMLETRAMSQPGLRKEYDQWLVDQTTKAVGNELFRGLPEEEQARIQNAIALADQGIFNKDITDIIAATGGDTPMSGGDVAGALKKAYGLEGRKIGNPPSEGQGIVLPSGERISPESVASGERVSITRAGGDVITPQDEQKRAWLPNGQGIDTRQAREIISGLERRTDVRAQRALMIYRNALAGAMTEKEYGDRQWAEIVRKQQAEYANQ